MKILILDIFGINSSGGTDRVSTMLANYLFDAGYEVVFASMGPCDKPFFPINQKIRIIPLVNYQRSNLGRLPVSVYDIRNIHNTIFRIRNIVFDSIIKVYKIRGLLKNEKIDTIIAVEVGCIEFTLPATLGLQIKHICWEHFGFNLDRGKKYSILKQLAARYCDAIVTLTERDRDYWLKGTSHKAQITDIPNPCPFLVQDYTKQENKKIVLAVGHLIHIKGFDMLIEAWIQVTRAMPDWTLKIVGEGADRDKLTELIKKNHLTDSVDLVGITDNVSKYYQQAEIFCLSSRFEGFGMVLIEALAFGLPIVSFNCEVGPAEVLENSGAILVPESNIDLLALSLIDLMGNEEQRRVISFKSKEKAKIYQPDNIINQWINLIESI